MSLPLSVQHIVRDAFMATQHHPQVLEGVEINRTVWCKLAQAWVEAAEPWAAREVAAYGTANTYATLGGQYIRKSRDAAIENVRDFQAVKKHLRRMNRIVGYRTPEGAMVTKFAKDCRPYELELVADEYERSAESDMRRARFYRTLAAQSRQMFGEDTTLRRWIAS